MMTDNQPAPYGYCPNCGAPGAERERRPNGNDSCQNGHIYPSAQAIKDPPKMEGVRNIDVKVSHSLGKGVAYERLLAMLAEADTNGPVTIKEKKWLEGKLHFVAEVYGVEVRGRLQVAEDFVALDTDPLPWSVLPVVWYQDKAIESKLREALK